MTNRHRIVGYVFGVIHFTLWVAIFMLATERMEKAAPQALVILLPIWFLAFVVLIFLSRWLIVQGWQAVRERRKAPVKR
jgi:hypothetical protein